MERTAARMTTKTDTTPSRQEYQRPSPTACPALVWARLTGRTVDLQQAPWLRGAAGATQLIGEEYFGRLAQQEKLRLQINAAGAGLMPRFDALQSDVFDPAGVHPRIRAFYEQTAAYRLDLWSCWCRACC